MDAITLLRDDHKLVRRLFREFGATTDRAVKTRERLARRLVKELSVHAAIEEQLLYPRVRQVLDDGDALADHALEEHQEAKELLERIDGLPGDDPALKELVDRLATAVTEHVKEEEGGLFKQLRAEVGRKQLAEWGEELQAARRKAPTHPHPHAPSRPPANKTLGVIAGAVDRARD
ncbi:MAG TPA: hemerythrin domain-containing protein, partial [Acidimicrobiales bacterium]